MLGIRFQKTIIFKNKNSQIKKIISAPPPSLFSPRQKPSCFFVPSRQPFVAITRTNPYPQKKSSLRNLLYSFLRGKNLRVSSCLRAFVATFLVEKKLSPSILYCNSTHRVSCKNFKCFFCNQIITHHYWCSGISAFSDALYQWNLSEERNFKFIC